MSAKTVRISLDAPALARGVGFFETLLAVAVRPVFFDDHFERLARSCRELDVPAPPRSAVGRAVADALHGGRRQGERGLRWTYLAFGQDLSRRSSWKFFAWAFPLPAEVADKRRGVRALLLPHAWRRLTPKWKTVDYRASVAGLRAAHRRGANEAFFVDGSGRILEGTACNVFAVDGRRVLTPPTSAGILPGVVRSWVLANARRAGLRVEERQFEPAALREGGFVTASLTGLAPMATLDGRRCAVPGERFESLRDLYRMSLFGRPAAAAR